MSASDRADDRRSRRAAGDPSMSFRAAPVHRLPRSAGHATGRAWRRIGLAGLLLAVVTAAQAQQPAPAAPTSDSTPKEVAAPQANDPTRTPAAADTCPDSALDLPLAALYGPWRAELEGEPGEARVELGPHPDYPGVRGRIVHAGSSAPPAQLAGDIDDQGMLSLDESADGRRITGVWLGEMVPGSCGRGFRGIRRDPERDANRRFTLTRLPPP